MTIKMTLRIYLFVTRGHKNEGRATQKILAAHVRPKIQISHSSEFPAITIYCILLVKSPEVTSFSCLAL